GRIEDLRAQYRGRFRLQWQGQASEFLQDLRGEGVQVVVDGRPDQAVAIVPQGWSTRTFFALADNRNMVLCGLHPEMEELEHVYHRLVAAESPESELQANALPAGGAPGELDPGRLHGD
ncbi:MAG TPA: hypothetical protein VET25_08705, partial [Aestuariivirgaceae bacterium]|nr:hypothetical protein [Aestuariivirgaceae bacterium]